MAVEPSGKPSRVGAQLELELAGPGLAWREPWGGVSPRGLIKMAQSVSLGAYPTRGLRDVITCPDQEQSSSFQLELFLQDLEV